MILEIGFQGLGDVRQKERFDEGWFLRTSIVVLFVGKRLWAPAPDERVSSSRCKLFHRCRDAKRFQYAKMAHLDRRVFCAPSL
jgi:hypothetical protein